MLAGEIPAGGVPAASDASAIVPGATRAAQVTCPAAGAAQPGGGPAAADRATWPAKAALAGTPASTVKAAMAVLNINRRPRVPLTQSSMTVLPLNSRSSAGRDGASEAWHLRFQRGDSTLGARAWHPRRPTGPGDQDPAALSLRWAAV